MSGQTNERAFESYVEEILHDQGGWQSGTNAEWDVERALFPARVCAFLEATQPKLWAEMRALHAAGLESAAHRRAGQGARIKGTLHVLRHGFKFYGKTFRLAYFKPAHGLNEEVLALYAQEPAHGHAPGALSSGQARHGGSAVRGERLAGGDLRAQESRHRPELAPRRAAVPDRTATRARRSSGSRSARWSISPPTRTKST